MDDHSQWGGAGRGRGHRGELLFAGGMAAQYPDQLVRRSVMLVPLTFSSPLFEQTEPKHFQALTAQHDHYSHRNQRPRAPTEDVVQWRVFQRARQALVVV